MCVCIHVQVFQGTCSSTHVDSLFSSDWKDRETSLSSISRQAISLLLPSMSSRDLALSSSPADSFESRNDTSPPPDSLPVQQVCMEVVKFSCGDSVLKVFLAALVCSYLFCFFCFIFFCCLFLQKQLNYDDEH